MQSKSAVSTVLSRFSTLLIASLAAYGVPAAVQAQTATFTGSQAVAFSSPTLTPYGVALDATTGDLYIADALNNQVLKVPAGGGEPTTVGSGLYFPTGVAVDSKGNVYIADSRNSRVVKVPGVGPEAVGIPIGVGFKSPSAVAVDASGNVYVADTGNNQVVEVAANGIQTALSAGFDQPSGLALDSFGNLYVADTGNNRIAILQWTGYSFSAAKTSVSGLNSPTGIAFDPSNSLYIAENKGSQILKSTLSASGGYGAPVAFVGGFEDARTVAVGPHGALYIGEIGTQEVLNVLAPGPSVNFGNANLCPAGQTQPAPCSKTVTLTFQVQGTGSDTPSFTALTLGAKNLDFKVDAVASSCPNNGNSLACSVNVVFTPLYAGTRSGAVQVFDSVKGTLLTTVLIYGDGEGAQIAYPFSKPVPWAAGSHQPNGIAVDGAGNVYVADDYCQGGKPCVYEIPAGIKPLVPIDVGSSTPIEFPNGIAVDGAGNLYIADAFGSDITEVLAGGGSRTIPSPYGNYNLGVAVDAAGNLFVVGSCLNSPPAGSTLWEAPASGGSPVTLNPVVDGLSVSCPTGIALDFAGNLFVADGGNGRVIEIPANGAAPFQVGSGFTEPWSVTVDGADNVFVADLSGGRLAEIPAGSNQVITLATASTLAGPPRGLALDAQGDLFVTGYTSNEAVLGYISFVTEFPRSTIPALQVPTGYVGIGDGTIVKLSLPQTATIQNIGNKPLVFSAPTTGSNPNYPAHFYANNLDANLCAQGKPVALGATCDLSLFISQAVTGQFNGSIVLTDNAYSLGNGTQGIPVTGNAIETTPMSFPTPAPMTFGQPLTSTQLNATVPAGIAGKFTYAPAAGTVLSTGTHSLKATFIPANMQQYAPNTATVTLVVEPALAPATATPTFTPAPGEYSSTQSVTIVAATSGAQIYYTTDGSTPTTSSTPYAGAIAVSQSETIQAIALAPNHTESQVASGDYSIRVPVMRQTATPTFTPAPGEYSSTQSVTIVAATSGAQIYYTTDGTTPTTASTPYTGAIAVSQTETIQAIATAPDHTESAMASGTYKFPLPPVLNK